MDIVWKKKCRFCYCVDHLSPQFKFSVISSHLQATLDPHRVAASLFYCGDFVIWFFSDTWKKEDKNYPAYFLFAVGRFLWVTEPDLFPETQVQKTNPFFPWGLSSGPRYAVFARMKITTGSFKQRKSTLEVVQVLKVLWLHYLKNV